MEAMARWWAGDPPPAVPSSLLQSQTFALAGYAGSGKTTVVAEFIRRFKEEHGDRVLVAAPTGKASLRLRQKGVRASTVHQIAYRYEGNDADGNPEFEFRGIAAPADTLVIVDESSMINTEMHRDLLSTGRRFLFVGDHGQLPPVGGDPGVMRHPDFVLQQIHRQDDVGLLDFAHALRAGEYIPPATGAVDRHWISPGPGGLLGEARDALRNAGVVICYLNRTRHNLNQRMLRQLGLAKDAYAADEFGTSAMLGACVDRPVRCIVLRNDYRLGLFNGQQVVMTVTRIAGRDSVIATLETDDDSRMGGVTVSCSAFGRNVEKDGQAPKGVALLDFGYAITCHKAQGSEWDHVCVWDDTFSKMDDRARWCYTAATRAKARLSWLHR